MENIVSISDDPNNQLAFVQQLVSQLSVGGGNPITINVVQTQQNVQGDIFYNGNSNNDNNNDSNDNSNNIVTKEYFDEKVAILSEASTDLDKKVAILSEALSDLDKKVANLSEALTNGKCSIKAGQTQRVAELSAVTTKLLAGKIQLITGITAGIKELCAGQAGLVAGVVNLSEGLTDVKAEQTQLVAGITAGINELVAGQTQTVAGMNLEVQAGLAGLKHARSAMDSFVNEIKR